MAVALKSLHLKSRFVLSPLAGYTNLPFRLAVRELGGLGLATTDLVNGRALLQRSRRTMELIETAPADTPVAVQIYGHEPPIMAEAAKWLEGYGVQSVDINMGCPVNKVTKNGGGSAMMCNVTNTVDLVSKVVAAVNIPVTVKMRLGWDSTNYSAPFFAREFEKVGVAAVTVHGRTREQGFGGQVDLDGIRAVVEAVEKIPIIGNGDVRTVADAERMFLVTGCAAIGIGRGALLNPWIFNQLDRWDKTGDPGLMPEYEDRLTFMSRHFHLLVAQRGERFGCLTFRKVANWYCRVLRPGKDFQVRMMHLDRVVDFDAMVDQLRERGAPPHWHRDLPPEIAVPRGPISHW